MTSITPTQPTGFLRLPQVLELIPIGKSTWWAGVKTGRFPQPVKLGPKTTMWRTEDIKALMVTLAVKMPSAERTIAQAPPD